MANKRTKKQKAKANLRHVNTQSVYQFNGSYNSEPKNKDVKITEKSNDLASIKKELYKSLIVSALILISLTVVYWFS